MRGLFMRLGIRYFCRNNFKMSRNYGTMCLKNYDCYGFDIDHTLAKYNLPTLFQDTYDAMTKYLVNRRGYDKDAFGFDQDFCTRGLVLDLELGNFFKLAEDGTILRATHGTRHMTEADLKKKFGEDIHWKHFDQLIGSVNNIGDRYRIFENFFDMPIGVVCAHVIDWIDKKADGKQPEKYNFWSDVVESIEFTYNPKQFKANEGDFFPQWKEDTGLYVQKCSQPLKNWLKQLRNGNKKLFVMTSSKEDFAQASLEFILGDDWHSYFDLYITLAKKPSFFTSDRSFQKLDKSGKGVAVAELCEGEIYQHGNAKVLMHHLAKFTGKDSPKVLFFGDSLRSDVFPAKKFADWDTVLVLEEINAHIQSNLSSQNCDEPPNKKQKTLKNPVSSQLCSHKWGSLFVDGQGVELSSKDAEPSHIAGTKHTLWSYIIRKYADIAVPRLDCMADYPMDYEFRDFDHNLRNGYGFYPNSPLELKDL